MSKIKAGFNKAQVMVQQNQPQILVYGGLTSTTVGVISAVHAGTKLPSIMDELDERKNEIINIDCDEDTKKKLRLKANGKAAIDIACTMAPPVALTVAGTVSVLAGFNIINKRYVGVCAAYATIQDSYSKYRSRIVEDHGKEYDWMVKNGVRAEAPHTVADMMDDATGEVTRYEAWTTEPSGYAKFFDEASTYWRKDANYNYSFVMAQQAVANEILQSKGILFLNDVYDLLDIPTTPEGQVVGWVRDSLTGDGFVDFGIHSSAGGDVAKRRFINGYENNILLDFNVDGVVLDII